MTSTQTQNGTATCVTVPFCVVSTNVRSKGFEPLTF